MNYRKIYNNLIFRAQVRKTVSGYFEIHHIIPRSYYKLHHLPVNNFPENLVRLPVREHLFAHLLLEHIYTGKMKILMHSAVTAIFRMHGQSLPYKVSKRVAEYINNYYERYGHPDSSQNVKQIRVKLYKNNGKICKRITYSHEQKIKLFKSFLDGMSGLEICENYKITRKSLRRLFLQYAKFCNCVQEYQARYKEDLLVWKDSLADKNKKRISQKLKQQLLVRYLGGKTLAELKKETGFSKNSILKNLRKAAETAGQISALKQVSYKNLHKCRKAVTERILADKEKANSNFKFFLQNKDKFVQCCKCGHTFKISTTSFYRNISCPICENKVGQLSKELFLKKLHYWFGDQFTFLQVVPKESWKVKLHCNKCGKEFSVSKHKFFKNPDKVNCPHRRSS